MMFFSNKKKKAISKIKIKALQNRNLLRKTSVFANNELLPIENIFVIKTLDEFKNHLYVKNNDNSFFIENFSNYDIDFLKQNYDLVLVKINFEIIKLVEDEEETSKLSYGVWTPINLWVLKKGSIDFFKLKEKRTLSCYPIILNKNTI